MTCGVIVLRTGFAIGFISTLIPGNLSQGSGRDQGSENGNGDRALVLAGESCLLLAPMFSVAGVGVVAFSARVAGACVIGLGGAISDDTAVRGMMAGSVKASPRSGGLEGGREGEMGGGGGGGGGADAGGGGGGGGWGRGADEGGGAGGAGGGGEEGVCGGCRVTITVCVLVIPFAPKSVGAVGRSILGIVGFADGGVSTVEQMVVETLWSFMTTQASLYLASLCSTTSLTSK